jgi:mannose-6-phosphate isomerase
MYVQMTQIMKLNKRAVEKPWGKTGIAPHFGADAKIRVGEIWFEPPSSRSLDVLVKYLFTTERLSIQVHPDNDTARARGYPHGKDECWIILSASEDAKLGIGTVHDAESDEVLAAAQDGSIVDLIEWRTPQAGDFIYNPAGTIHALGAGLTVLEIQQAVDITYRLHDFGRSRKLHLEESRNVVNGRPHRHPLDRCLDEESALLVVGPYFGLAWCVEQPPALPVRMRDVQLIPIDVAVSGIGPGECALIDPHIARTLRSVGKFVLTWSVPEI